LRIFFAAKLNRESQSYFCNQTRLIAVQKRTAMDTVWNIGFAIAVVITWFRARLNERK
jgi:hypothetical protein